MRSAGVLLALHLTASPGLAQVEATATPTRLGTATPTPRRTPGPRPVKVKLTAAEAEALVKEMSARVEKIRHLKFGDYGTPDTAEALAAAAFAGVKFWPHDEGVGQWPPARGPDVYLD